MFTLSRGPTVQNHFPFIIPERQEWNCWGRSCFEHYTLLVFFDIICSSGKCILLVASLSLINCLFADPLPFKCSRCGRGYSVHYTLERHLKYECGVAKQFACAICLRKFSRRDILRTHEKKFNHFSHNNITITPQYQNDFKMT